MSGAAPVINLSLYTPLPEKAPVDELVIDTRETDVSTESVVPGGWHMARIGIPPPDSVSPLAYPYLPRPVEATRGMHAELTDGSDIFFAGVVDDVTERRGAVVGLTLRGYGLAATNWSELDAPQEGDAQSDVIVHAALASNDWLSAGRIAATGARFPWEELDGQTLAQVLERVASQGSPNLGLLWDWMVYGGQRLDFVPRIAPPVPEYRHAPGDDTTITRVFSDCFDRARVRYQDTDGNDRLTPWFYARGVNPNATHLVSTTIPGGALGETEASQYAQTWILQHGEEQLSGTILLSRWGGLSTAGNAVVPGHLVKAGQWAEIENYGRGMLSAVRSTLSDGSTDIQLGAPPPGSFEAFANHVGQTTEALRSEISPVTGARLFRRQLIRERRT